MNYGLMYPPTDEEVLDKIIPKLRKGEKLFKYFTHEKFTIDPKLPPYSPYGSDSDLHIPRGLLILYAKVYIQ